MVRVRSFFPRGSRTAAPRDRTAGLRRGIVLLAITLTVLAGPLGRTLDQGSSDEVFGPVTVTSFTVAGPAR